MLIIRIDCSCSNSESKLFSEGEIGGLFSGDDFLYKTFRFDSIFLSLSRLLSLLESSVRNSLFIIAGGVSVWYKRFFGKENGLSIVFGDW